MDFFKKLFGFPPQTHPGESRRPETIYPPQPFDDNLARFFSFEEDSFSHHFQQQIETFFDREMEEILKSFGMPSFGTSKLPSLEPHTPDSRDYYLKPNYPNEKVDEDVDGKLSVNDLDRFLKNPQKPAPLQKIIPDRFFNQSVSVKTIRNPDGSFETQKTVTDSEGNQETTVTKKQGEKEYTIIKKRDRDGKEEVHENMINMTEDEKYLFGNKKNNSNNPSSRSDLFDKFFK
ncbi:unnamed protein product [Ceutorhynchus assimilis]|uniref:HCLS1-associated protein X-1 n=1 Tax=Ceutorhynchus assimilis TaxID=467358 RepID=A0A9N9MUX5_9CUCU|nr:unnamed protein product [Ceutorhynchus assimilis]